MTPEYSTHSSNAASIIKNPSASPSSSPANSNASTPVKTTSVSAINQTKSKAHPKLLPDRTVSSNNSGIQSNVENVRVPPCCQMTAAVVSIVSAGNAGGSDGCKKMSKFDSRLGPSPFRQLLPIALCILSFATVLSILIVYMDTTEIRHQQFRLNMSRDYEMYGVQQDDPTLIAFLREIHMKKYPMHFLKNSESGEHLNFTQRHEMTPEMAQYIANLVGSKSNGAFVQSMTGSTNYLMTAPWLAETLNWSGLIVEPEPRRYFSLRKQNIHRPKVQVVHACVSPNIHPKEVTIHNEDSEVRINSLLDEETSWFNSRVKCFPLYTFMMAINRADYDLLSLGVPGHELQILETLPFEKVDIKVISIHLTEEQDNPNEHIKPITKFLSSKSYKMQKQFGPNYIYIKINANRSRKKDILLLRKP